jgi:hypothetical protein
MTATIAIVASVRCLMVRSSFANACRLRQLRAPRDALAADATGRQSNTSRTPVQISPVHDLVPTPGIPASNTTVFAEFGSISDGEFATAAGNIEDPGPVY